MQVLGHLLGRQTVAVRPGKDGCLEPLPGFDGPDAVLFPPASRRPLRGKQGRASGGEVGAQSFRRGGGIFNAIALNSSFWR
jgi:hypothetical protein